MNAKSPTAKLPTATIARRILPLAAVLALALSASPLPSGEGSRAPAPDWKPKISDSRKQPPLGGKPLTGKKAEVSNGLLRVLVDFDELGKAIVEISSPKTSYRFRICPNGLASGCISDIKQANEIEDLMRKGQNWHPEVFSISFGRPVKITKKNPNPSECIIEATCQPEAKRHNGKVLEVVSESRFAVRLRWQSPIVAIETHRKIGQKYYNHNGVFLNQIFVDKFPFEVRVDAEEAPKTISAPQLGIAPDLGCKQSMILTLNGNETLVHQPDFRGLVVEGGGVCVAADQVVKAGTTEIKFPGGVMTTISQSWGQGWKPVLQEAKDYDDRLFLVCDLAAWRETSKSDRGLKDWVAEIENPGQSSASKAAGPWPREKANAWHAEKPWLLGCNFIPSSAINQLEMWQADTFDLATIDRELGWAEDLGFNSVRVFLHHLLWQQDSKGFLGRMDKFLATAEKHKIGVMFVLLDSCWDPFPKLGKQRDPKPHVHNSGWVQGPGAAILKDPKRHGELEAYVKGVIGRFKTDRRIHVWDIINEPDNTNGSSYGKDEPANKAELALALLEKSFGWAREVGPAQPITSGVWAGDWSDLEKLSSVNRFQLEQSDVITFHNYGAPDDMKRCVKILKRYQRPMLCTEYMARPAKSTFDPILGYLKAEKVAAYNWGFVDGKTQTIYPWDSWKKAYTAEPPVWFHDIFRRDGKPYDPKEVEYIKGLTGKIAR